MKKLNALNLNPLSVTSDSFTTFLDTHVWYKNTEWGRIHDLLFKDSKDCLASRSLYIYIYSIWWYYNYVHISPAKLDQSVVRTWMMSDDRQASQNKAGKRRWTRDPVLYDQVKYSHYFDHRVSSHRNVPWRQVLLHIVNIMAIKAQFTIDTIAQYYTEFLNKHIFPDNLKRKTSVVKTRLPPWCGAK